MPLDIENDLPVINVLFVKYNHNEISFLCYIDTCAVMYTVNLPLQQWVITKYPNLVAEYILYDDSTPFDQIKISYAVPDYNMIESQYGNIATIVRY